MEEQINKIVKMMEEGRPDIVTFLAGVLFLNNGEVDQTAKATFEEKTGFKVVAGKTQGLLGGYILADGEKWYFA